MNNIQCVDNVKIIIGVDGISYSGKTTLCNELKRTRNFIIVDESPKFANVKIKITSDQNDIINNSKMTLAIEKERKKFVDNLKDKIFVYDRSIFSFLAISFAYYKFGIIDYFEEYLYHIIEGLKKDEFSIPDYLIYLKIDNNELQRRITIKKKHLPDYWISRKFNLYYNDFLSLIYDFYKKNNRILIKSDIFSMETTIFTKIEKNDVINFLGGINKCTI